MTGKKLAVLSLVAILLAILAGCSPNSPSGGTITPQSGEFTAAGSIITLTKRAPYTTRLDGTTAVADFSIRTHYWISQRVDGPPNVLYLNATINNIQISQPSLGRITLNRAWMNMFDEQAVGPGAKSISFSTSNPPVTGSFEVTLELMSDEIGVISVRDYTIAATQEEANQYFDQYLAQHNIKEDKLSFTLKFRIEISVLENGKEAKYFRDMTILVMPKSEQQNNGGQFME